MIKGQVKKKTILKLKGELAKFGLNPIDWRISKQPSKSYRIESKLDQGFAFIGKVRKRGPHLKWRSLELVSL